MRGVVDVVAWWWVSRRGSCSFRREKAALLEFYEGVYEFRSNGEAREFADGSIGSNRLDDALKEFPYRVQGVEITAFGGVMDAKKNDTESLFRIVALQGRSVITISAQGGRELSWSTIRPTVDSLIAKLQTNFGVVTRQAGAPKGAPALYDSKSIVAVAERASSKVTAVGVLGW